MQGLADNEVTDLKEIFEIHSQWTKLQRLAWIKSNIQFLEEEIEVIERTSGIVKLREHIVKYSSEYKKELDALVPTLTFKEDAILKAAKVKGDSYREGNLKLVRKPRTVRSVKIEQFLEAYLDLDILKRVVKIEVGKAEDEVGKRALDQFVEKKTTYIYELQDLNR